MRSRRGLLPLLLLIAALAACGRKPAQDYVVTGTLRMSPEVAREFNRMLGSSRTTPDFERFDAFGAVADVTMTVRTSPDVGDVIIQRQWKGVGLPLEFGLGKGRGSAVASRHDEVFVTAIFDIYQRRGAKIMQTFVGWTREPVKVGTYHIDMELDLAYGEASPDKGKNFPTGGWTSRSVREEATPPGLRRSDPGPLVFAGTIDVDARARERLRGFRVFVIARERQDAGAPELVTYYDNPVLPFRFSLHQNQVQVGEPAPVEHPKYITALLDFDGVIDTKEDQLRAVTPEKVEPGTTDVELVFELGELAERLEEMARREPPPSPDGHEAPDPHDPHAHGEPPATHGKGKHVASGRITIPADAAGRVSEASVLYLTLRDPESDQTMLVKRVARPTFPFAFDIHEGDNEFGGAVQVSKPVRVRAILSLDGKGFSGPNTMRATSETVPVGASGLELELGAP